MDVQHRQSIVLVTGAGRGIGAAIAKAFAGIGLLVILGGRDRKSLKRTEKEILRAGGRAVSLACDVSSEKSVSKALRTVLDHFKHVDVLVNNAGVTYFKKFEDTTIKEFDQIIATNLRGMFMTTKAVLPSMLRNARGVIINIHSVSADTVFSHSSVYAASKAGSLMMSRCLRHEVRTKGIRIIDVLPGAVETAMWSEGNRKKFGSKMMQPDDVAQIVVSLYCQPRRATTDEIVIRPVEGDLS